MTSPGPTGSCPKCGATNLQEVKVKRSSVDRAIVAEYLRVIGSRGTGIDGILTQQVCQRCGCRWLPRTAQERQLRALSGQLGPEAMKAAQAEEAAKAAKAAKHGYAGGRPKVRPLTVVLAAIIVILLILVAITA